MEILLIAGIDTFSLNGRGLSPLVKAGDSVTAGQPIMEMDLSQVRSAGLSPMVITVLSNPEGSTRTRSPGRMMPPLTRPA